MTEHEQTQIHDLLAPLLHELGRDTSRVFGVKSLSEAQEIAAVLNAELAKQRKRKPRNGEASRRARDTHPNAATPSDAWQHELATALDDVRIALGAGANDRRIEPMFGDVVDLFDATFTEDPWLVDGLILRGGVAVIGAEPKVGKSWLACELAVALATGTPALGRFHVHRGRVAYFFCEDGARQVRGRMLALLAGRGVRGVARDRLFVQPRGRSLDITNDSHLAALVASGRRLGPLDLVILDPLRDVHNAAEDKSDEMKPVMERLRILGVLLGGATVLSPHHNRKGSLDTSRRQDGQELRGSGAIYGALDSLIALEPLDDGDDADPQRHRLGIKCKTRSNRPAAPFATELDIEDDATGAAMRATWRDVELPKKKSSLDRIADKVVAAAVAKADGFESKNQLIEAAGVGRTFGLKAIDRELDNGRLEKRGMPSRIYARAEVLPS